MEINSFYLLIGLLVTVLATYLPRVIPLAFIKEKINNKFVISFLYYMPYAVLGAMTFPGVLSSTSNTLSAAIGMAIAIVAALFKGNLLFVATLSTLAVFITELVASLSF